MMSGDSIGREFIVTSFGESHGKCVGVVVQGVPAGLTLDVDAIQKDLERRRPGNNIETSTARNEEDKVEVISGVFNGITTGAPICALVWNKDTVSTAYEKRRFTPRPGHADYTAFIKYGGFEDYRGGGRFSARNTVGLVIAGAIAKQALQSLEIDIVAHTTEIGGIAAREVDIKEIRENSESNAVRCADKAAAEKMIDALKKAKKEGDSLGGVIEGIVLGIPVGLGEPVFDNLDSDLSKALFAIPAVKAVEFGSGFAGSRLRGSQNNDAFRIKDGRIITTTNRSGGILGGISDGMPVTVRVGFKPIASIPRKQETVNMKNMENAEIEVIGRFDPCPVPRAVPIVESVIAIVLCDFAIRQHFISPVMKK
jgi:chorismate synthase